MVVCVAGQAVAGVAILKVIARATVLTGNAAALVYIDFAVKTSVSRAAQAFVSIGQIVTEPSVLTGRQLTSVSLCKAIVVGISSWAGAGVLV